MTPRAPVRRVALGVLAVAATAAAGTAVVAGDPAPANAASTLQPGCTSPAPKARGAGSAAAAVRKLVRPISTDLTREPKVRSPARRAKAPRRVVKDDVVRCGTGAVVRRGDTVEVRYSLVAWGRGSTPRESSWSRQPTSASFALNRSTVIDGWVEAIPGMRVGGRRVLVVPPSKGYGSKTVGKIPGNSTLIFVVDVVATS